VSQYEILLEDVGQKLVDDLFVLAKPQALLLSVRELAIRLLEPIGASRGCPLAVAREIAGGVL
jgi:hypothetical protein